MKFPATERVIYRTNPLSEVIFQVRFPRIFAIDDRLPAEFQSALGAEFPFTEAYEAVNLGQPPATEHSPLKRSHYEFFNEDRSTMITLTSEFIAVTTTKYERWERFKSQIEAALSAIERAYSLPLFTRVGLRYVDKVSKSELGLKDVRWSDLIRVGALAVVADDEVPLEDVIELQTAISLQMPDDARALIRTGFEKPASGDGKIFVVDSDFYVEQSVKGKAHALDLCSTFNKYAGDAFRWFISEKLHAALDPQKP